MNSENNNYDNIEAYLLGQMSSEQAASFEKEIEQNKELARAVEQQRLEHRAMHLLLRKDLQSNIEAWKQEKLDIGQNAKVIPMRRRFLQFAAAACLIAILGWFANHWLNPIDYPAMAAGYFDESSASVRSGERPESQNLSTALQKMREGDYQAAIENIQAEKDSTFSEIALFLKGECYFRLGEYSEASFIFQQIIQSTSSVVSRQKAEWHLLLTYLAAGGKSDRKFKALLSQILSDPSHAFNREATTLKKRL